MPRHDAYCMYVCILCEPYKRTCQVQLLCGGVTLIPGAGHAMPSSVVDLRCPISGRSDAQPGCWPKVVGVHVCACLCPAPRCVSQPSASSETEGAGVCPSVRLSLGVSVLRAMPFRHVALLDAPLRSATATY